MAGILTKRFVTVVMDGSDNNVLSNITGIVDMFTKERHGKATCRPLDNEHPTMTVIETYTNGRTYNHIQEVIEEQYPGLCVFNPAV